MAFFNYSTMQMTAKIVYYGPGLGGKTTNLQHIYQATSEDSRGEMVSLETEADRTLFFDLLPMEVGVVSGFKTRLQLYTVPGQVFYNTTRKLVLKAVDGIVFVADSQRAMMDANLFSMRNLQENLAELDLDLDSVPIVLQYNKRDLPGVCSLDELNAALNPRGKPFFESVATEGEGVFETLRGISRLTLEALRSQLEEDGYSDRGETPADAAAKAPSKPAAAAAPPAPPPTRAAQTATTALANGRQELNRQLRVVLGQQMSRAHRVSLHLQVEDENHRIVRLLPNLQVEIDQGSTPNDVLLRLHVELTDGD